VWLHQAYFSLMHMLDSDQTLRREYPHSVYSVTAGATPHPNTPTDNRVLTELCNKHTSKVGHWFGQQEHPHSVAGTMGCAVHILTACPAVSCARAAEHL
jgi:hypothetical protein